MDELRTRALLVDFDPTTTGTGAIGTVLSRDEIAETKAQGEFPATLLLELDRIEKPGAPARVAVDWDEDTLDQLLASTEADEIALWFDEGELARAFDEREVEAHGLREKAAVLAVAVVAAGASTAPAFARFAADTPDSGGTPTAAFNADPQASHTGAVVQTAGAERALQQDEQVAVQQSQGTTGTGSGFNVDPQASHTGAVAQPAGAERGLQQDEQVAQSQGTTGTGSAVTSSGGSVLSDGEIALIAGSLVILAAGFGATHRRTPPALPA
jgi:hypothetical protein